MSMLNLIRNGQVEMAAMLAANGMKAKAIEFIPKIRKTSVEMAESSGLKNPDEYYPDFTPDEMAAAIEAANQPQPDPAIALEQAKGEVTLKVEEGKNQLAMQKMQVDAQLSQHDAELKAQGEIAKNTAELQADLQTKEADRQNALLLAQQEANLKLEMQARDQAFQLQLERERMANAQTIASMKPDPKPASAAAN